MCVCVCGLCECGKVVHVVCAEVVVCVGIAVCMGELWVQVKEFCGYVGWGVCG